MGNELLTQVGNSGLPSVTNQTAAPITSNAGFGNNMTGSLFNMGISNKNYDNDFIMPDYLKTGNITEEQRASIFGPMYVPTQQQTSSQGQYPVVNPQQNTPQQYVTQPQQMQIPVGQQYQPQLNQEQIQQLYNELQAKNPNIRITEKGNLYEVSNAGKKTGAIAGIIASLGSGIAKICKGSAITKAFNLKSLAVKVPVLAIAGWAVGSLIDTFTNSSRAKQADCVV